MPYIVVMIMLLRIIDFRQGNYFAEMSVFGVCVMLFALFFLLTLNWFLRKKAINFVPKEDQSLQNYILNFEHQDLKDIEVVPAKKISIATKLVLFIMALVIAFTLLYYFIATLNPESFWYGNYF